VHFDKSSGKMTGMSENLATEQQSHISTDSAPF